MHFGYLNDRVPPVGGAPGCGYGWLVMCTEMDRWSYPPMGAALVTEIVEQSISVATMSMHEKGVPQCRYVGKLTICLRPYNPNNVLVHNTHFPDLTTR